MNESEVLLKSLKRKHMMEKITAGALILQRAEKSVIKDALKVIEAFEIAISRYMTTDDYLEFMAKHSYRDPRLKPTMDEADELLAEVDEVLGIPKIVSSNSNVKESNKRAHLRSV